MFLNILVAVDGTSSARALEQAIDVATAMNSRLTLIAVAPQPPWYITRAGVSQEMMGSELERWAGSVLDTASGAIPDDVIAHTLQRTGHAGPAILEEIERGGYDLVVLGSRGRFRGKQGLLGSVTSYLHFHSSVPLLSVPSR